MGDIPLFRGVSDRTGCSTPSPVPSHSGRGVGRKGNIPLFRGVADRTGCSFPCGWGLQTTPSGFACHPFGEGEYSRGIRRMGCSLPLGWGLQTTPLGYACHPFEKGNLAPSPVPSHSGRGVGKGWGVHSRVVGDYRLPRQAMPATPSRRGIFEGCPIGRGVHSPRGWGLQTTPSGFACHPFEKGNIQGCPTGRGVHFRVVGDYRLPHPLPTPLPVGEGWAEDGVFAPAWLGDYQTTPSGFACHPFGEGEYLPSRAFYLKASIYPEMLRPPEPPRLQ